MRKAELARKHEILRANYADLEQEVRTLNTNLREANDHIARLQLMLKPKRWWPW